ncbi:MAG: hypothetical protein SPI15_07515 [Candidatus Faecousia sp.]|nr:hypothetical protein [Candidatus Faecousia sp.]
MSDYPKVETDPRLEQKMKNAIHRDRWTDHFFRRVLHVIERFIAVLTILGLISCLVAEVYEAVVNPEYLTDAGHMLHNLLTIVVGLEFVRMLIDTTPANILEVLTVAITRHVILSHDDPWSNVACIACIAGLFAIRRFLVPKSELKEEMVEIE